MKPKRICPDRKKRWLVVFACCLASCQAGSDRTTLQVGFAVRDITPNATQIATKKIYLGAYGAPYSRWATGVHDPIFARAMAVECGSRQLLLVACDLPGIGHNTIAQIKDRVTRATKIDPNFILIGVTHTHSAPDLQGVWGGVPQDYRETVITHIAQAMTDAYALRVPARLVAGEVQAANRNRRGWDVTDDTLTVVGAYDLDQKRLGTLVNFAAHPVVLGEANTEVTRDFVGTTVDALETQLGGPVIFFNGVVGDASPVVPDGTYQNDFERAQAVGLRLVEAALVADSKASNINQLVRLETVTWEQEVNNVLFLMAIDLIDYSPRVEIVDGQEHTYLQLSAGYFRFGQALQGISFPGESLSRNGLAIKLRMQAHSLLFLGLTNGSVGYFVPGDEWQSDRNENYEEVVSLDQSAGDRALEEIDLMLQRDPRPWAGS